MIRRWVLGWLLVLVALAGCGTAKVPPEPTWLEQGRRHEAAGWPGDALAAYRAGLAVQPGDAELQAALVRVTNGLAERAGAALANYQQERGPEAFLALLPLLDAYLRMPEGADVADYADGQSLRVLLTPGDGVRVVSLYGGPMVDPKRAQAHWIQWFDGSQVHAQPLERPGVFGALAAGLPEGPGSRSVLIKTGAGEHPYTMALALWRLDATSGRWRPAPAFGPMPEVVGLGRIYATPERIWVDQYGERAGWLEIEDAGRRISLRGDGIIPVVYADWNGQRYEVVAK